MTIDSKDLDYATFTVNLGEEKNLCGFYLGGYVMKNFEVEVSKDNKTWTQIGDSEGHNYVYDYDYETYSTVYEYVLYGSVSCRYLKFKAHFNTSGYYWNYYRRFNNLSLYFN